MTNPDLLREKREYLLLASYCGEDNDACTERRPCEDCLAMCNIFNSDGGFIRVLSRARAQAMGEEAK